MTSVDLHKKLNSKFSVNPDFAICDLWMSYCIIVLHKPLYWNLWCWHAQINNSQLFRQTNEFARNIFHTNIMYLKAFTGVKISTFFFWGGGGWWVKGSWNGTIKLNLSNMMMKMRNKIKGCYLYIIVDYYYLLVSYRSKCISDSHTCDLTPDCPDNSDEDGCRKYYSLERYNTNWKEQGTSPRCFDLFLHIIFVDCALL